MFNYLYKHEDILMYLRFHPMWYKILHYDKSRFKDFLLEAKSSLKITYNDKLDNFNKKIEYFKMFRDYILKDDK